LLDRQPGHKLGHRFLDRRGNPIAEVWPAPRHCQQRLFTTDFVNKLSHNRTLTHLGFTYR